MTSTDQLNARCRDVPGFLGTFASDQLPERPPPGSSLIVNYSPHTQGGSHWVAMHFPAQRGPPRYFDSYGEGPDGDSAVLQQWGTRFGAYLRKNGNGFAPVWNRFDLQTIAGNECGEWSCFFVHAGGQLPRIEHNKFAGPWGLFELDRRHLPLQITQADLPALAASDPKDEAVAKRNDARVRKWAGIVRP